MIKCSKGTTIHPLNNISYFETFKLTENLSKINFSEYQLNNNRSKSQKNYVILMGNLIMMSNLNGELNK